MLYVPYVLRYLDTYCESAINDLQTRLAISLKRKNRPPCIYVQPQVPLKRQTFHCKGVNKDYCYFVLFAVFG